MTEKKIPEKTPITSNYTKKIQMTTAHAKETKFRKNKCEIPSKLFPFDIIKIGDGVCVSVRNANFFHSPFLQKLLNSIQLPRFLPRAQMKA